MIAITATCLEKSNVRDPSTIAGTINAGKSNGMDRAGAVAGETRSSDWMRAMLVFSLSARASAAVRRVARNPLASRLAGAPRWQSHSAGILVCAEHVFERPRDMQRE